MIMSESRTRKYSSVGLAILNHWLSTQGLLRMGYLHQTILHQYSSRIDLQDELLLRLHL